jgi:hypothetical protein
MKKTPFYLAAFLIFLFCACKKSNSSNNNSNSNSWLSSITSWSPGSSIVDSFTYDSSHRVASFLQFENDTTSGNIATGNWSAVFSLPAASSAPPTTYTNTLTGTSELHQLLYDGQGRIIEDSSTGTSGWIIYFSYPGNNIAITALFDGTIADGFVDTLFPSGGNISNVHVYGPNNAGTADSLEAAIKFGYSSIANPAYHSAIASSLGPLIYVLAFAGYGGNIDPISQKAFNSLSGVGDGLPSNVTVGYTLTTDSQGRLIQQTVNYNGAAGALIYRYY